MRQDPIVTALSKRGPRSPTTSASTTPAATASPYSPPTAAALTNSRLPRALTTVEAMEGVNPATADTSVNTASPRRSAIASRTSTGASTSSWRWAVGAAGSRSPRAHCAILARRGRSRLTYFSPRMRATQSRDRWHPARSWTGCHRSCPRRARAVAVHQRRKSRRDHRQVGGDVLHCLSPSPIGANAGVSRAARSRSAAGAAK